MGPKFGGHNFTCQWYEYLEGRQIMKFFRCWINEPYQLDYHKEASEEAHVEAYGNSFLWKCSSDFGMSFLRWTNETAPKRRTQKFSEGSKFFSIKYENGDDNVKLALFFVGFWYK